ncbi:MAG: dNTP triphosphohydrolase [Candidatus Peregrinibacteria bacterium]|nr:dNTP triphosphohydrolase [Candidatus Peregrinibacteria bacterium]
MKPLSQRIRESDALLARYAVPHGGALGRVHPEADDETRFPFQRDGDRIIHTQAFRRLQGKTQVFIAGEGDHYRTRLTHTMEVAQIARDLARTLSLNEDLTEAIALAHDLGHPPFGHMGEEALDAWMREQGMHFEHNEQSVRIVSVLEEHSSQYIGLNLNQEILEGLRKHRPLKADASERALSLEAQIVNLADEIAYTAHDCDDGLRAGLFTLVEIRDVPLAQDALARSAERGTSLRGGLIHLLVSDLYQQTTARIERASIGSLENVYAAQEPIAAFSHDTQERLATMRSFLWEHMYLHPTVRKSNEQGQRVVRSLCAYFLEHPNEKISSLQRSTGATLPEAVKDYVAGMTDAYARAQAENLRSSDS